jgi:hypothetical protein
VVALLLALVSGVLYAATAAPTVATIFDDSLEFQVVLPTLGIAHPSGYPLYTLLGKAATWLLPVRDAAGRANLFSALAAAAAVGLLYATARRLAANRVAAATAVAAFALSPVWWSQATIAEVYAPHGLLLLLLLYSLVRWEGSRRQVSGGSGPRDATSPPSSIPSVRNQSPGDAWLAAAALAFGLGLAHHRMIALLLPAALVFVLWTEPGLLRRPRRWLPLLACGLAPLLLYAYLPLRGLMVGSLDGTYTPTLAGTVDWVLARAYSVFLTGNPFGVSRTFGQVLALFVAQSGVLLLATALLGLADIGRFGRRRYVFLLLATAAQIAFGVAYKVEDVGVFLLPAFMLLALWAAWGVTPASDALAARGAAAVYPLPAPNWLRRVLLAGWSLSLAIVLLFEPVRAAVVEFPQRDRSRAWETYDMGQDWLAHVAPGGQVVGLLGEATLLRYFRDVLGQRPDVTVTPADAEAARLAAVDAALAQGRPVYLTRDLPGAAARYSLDAAGPLIAVSPKAAPAAPPAGQTIGAGIVLVGARTETRSTHAGPVTRVTLTWAAAAAIREELKVSARLVDAGGQVVAVEDRAPVHFTYPTTAWTPGEIVTDVYDLQPPSVSAGPYTVLLILYRAADGSEVGRTAVTTRSPDRSESNGSAGQAIRP